MFKLIAAIGFVGTAIFATAGTDTNTGAPCTTTIPSTQNDTLFAQWVTTVGGHVNYHDNGTWTNKVGNVVGYSDTEDGPICAY
jgi:hypothetical protein